MENELKSLETFLLDIECLDKLKKYENELNIFKITGMENQEIKHSNFLSWLLNANQNHKLGDFFIKKFLFNIIKNSKNEEVLKEMFSTKEKSLTDILLLDFYDFNIYRESNNLDIFLISKEQKTTITIENKIFAKENIYAFEEDEIKQTELYREKVNNLYNDYTNIFIYLTPYGEKAFDSNNWFVASYEMIDNILDEILTTKKEIITELKLLLNNYKNLLRRNILKNEELEKICLDIYKKHQAALDLIFEYKPNYLQKISDYIKNFMKENKNNPDYNLNYDEKDSSGKSYIRFTTKYIDKIIPYDSSFKDGWGNGRGLMYEIEILQTGSIQCIATISNSNNDNCKKIFNYVIENKKEFNVQPRKLNIWSRVWKSKPLLKKEEIDKLTFVEIEDNLKSRLIDLLKTEIPSFENKIKDLNIIE